MARWSDDRLVNTYGELFQVSAKSVPNATTLPRFAGPDEAVADITQRYSRFTSILAPLSTEIVSLRLTPRLAWQMRLADGLAIELGREHGDSTPEMRLMRFVEVYPTQIATLSRRLKTYVDLRYPQGFAVRDPDIERRVQERLREELNERGPLERMRSAA